MRMPLFIARQAGRPTGCLGHLIAWIMVRMTADENQHAVAMLDVRPDDHVLDIGAGNGRTLGLIAALAERGLAVGVDHSNVMCARAKRHNRRRIRNGLVRVEQASSDDLPFGSATFDAALSVHTIYFWNPVEPHLAEIARVLRPGGRFILAFHPSDDPKTVQYPAPVYRFRSAREVEAFLGRAGFKVMDVRREENAEGITEYIKAERMP